MQTEDPTAAEPPQEGDDTPAGAEGVAAEIAATAPQPIIAGIGASAGGIEALQAFFETLPENLGVAFVVVVHLSPEHRSELASVLASRTPMAVEQVTGTVPLRENHVYVVPPDRRLQISDSELSAMPFDEPRGQRAPIDLFFRSLAEQHGDGFAVVLSGGGSDGAVGVKAIKEAGGLVLVQDPNEAAHDSMPRAAIATEVADVVLPVRELAGRLADLTHTKRRVRETLRAEVRAEFDGEDEAVLGRVLTHLHARTGHDFSKYKRATVLRRLGRRMQVHRKETLGDYLAFLRTNVEEAQALFNDMLISVTTFFRDPVAWETLADQVIPRLFESEGAEHRIRIWVPGCATGEEAYSLAILVLEEAHRRDLWPEVQIFATDLDEGALATAREGRYPTAIEADVSEERLHRFFRREGEHYCVTKEVRDCVLFAIHSLLRDPPFSRLDLVSCRNLLIYLDRDLQQQVFGIIRYALRSGGYLFLGASESAEGRYFRVLDKQHHLYQAREVRGEDIPHLPDLLLSTPRLRTPAEHERPRQAPEPAEDLHRRALEDLAPPSILVDEERSVIHLSESAGRFLQPPGGPFTREVTRLVRPELQVELRAGLFRALERGEESLSPFLPVELQGASQRVAVLVRPRAGENGERSALVVFIEGGEATPFLAEPGEGEASVAAARHLEEELRQAREQLRTTREEFEAANEELRSANEELHSLNEEYRSTAEELETSKEELQSINEELETVNHELKLKLQEVSRAHSDLENLMSATEIGTLFLDRGLRIARFTPSVTDLFNVTEADRGRPITDFTHRLDYPGLVADTRGVLEDLAAVEQEVRSLDGRWYLARLRPYRTLEHKIDGVVATFVDITQRKQAEEALRQSEERYRVLVEGVAEYGILMMDPEGRIVTWNTGAERLFGFSEREALGRSCAIIFPEEAREQGAPEDELEMAAREGQAADERWHVRKDGSRFWGSGVMTALRQTDGSLRGFAKVLRDDSERKAGIEERERLLAAAQQAREEAEIANQVKSGFMATLSHELRTPLNAVVAYAELLERGIPMPIPAPARQHTERILLSSRLLTYLIDDMLTFSRIEAGREGVVLERIELRPLLDEIEAIAAPLATAKDLAFRLARQDGAPEWIVTDPRKLRSVLLNLVGNAVKFTERGEIELTVRALPQGVGFQVRDTGIGIAAEDLERLFEPFWQRDSSLTRTAGGAGLGLAIARRFVEMLGGAIEVESRPGEGSLFRVRLPDHPREGEGREHTDSAAAQP